MAGRTFLSWSYALLADSYIALGDLDAADAAHKKQLELTPQNPWKHANYADFLLESAGDVQHALDEAERAHALADNGDSRYVLANARIERANRSLWERNDVPRARADYDAALALDPRRGDAYYGRAACSRYLAMVNHDPKLVAKAREDLERALKIDPNHALSRRAMADLDAVTRAAKSER